MSWVNYDDVLGQLAGAGLLIDGIEVGRMRRCKIDSDREKRGWYFLHEIPTDAGDLLLVGSYGVWHGNDNGARKIALRRADRLTPEQQEAVRKRLADDRKRAEAARKRENAEAARQALKVWRASSPTGESEYLARKGVQAFGVRYTPSGALVVPMLDAAGVVHGLQFILPADHPRRKKTGRDKEYWPVGLAKRGHWFMVGPPPTTLCLVAEGYATAATLHQATGYPVAVAFDAGNLMPVAEAIKKAYRSARILLCADDDYLTAGNPGVSAAQAAALAIDGAVAVPIFTVDRGGKKFTDFNDLAALEGQHVVGQQVTGHLLELGWTARATGSAGLATGGAGERPALASMLSLEEALERFAMVYGGGGTLFDHQEHMLVPKADVVDILPEHGWRDMRARKQVVRLSEVGFDPAGTDRNILCNLWAGWPTAPKQGRCEVLLDLLLYLCSHEKNAREIYDWVLKWLAYPIQHPGAKMRTALVFHGPQGAGKNLFFETIMAIYGEYGRIVDQSAIEDKFNDWASRKLFLIADEVVARAELFHVKNKLKGIITGEWIRINPKNVAAHDEKNHVNVVFLSNEHQPLVLDKDDRRYTVVWTPEKLPPDFYADVRAELDAGGMAALHHHLLGLDLGDFNEHSKPPLTLAKSDLIELGKPSVERFLDDWIGGYIDGLPFCPCGSEDLYTAYLQWCRRDGVTRPREKNQFSGVIARMPGWEKTHKDRYDNTHYSGNRKRQRFILPSATALLEAIQAGQPDYRCPESKNQTQWLTDCFFDFHNALGGHE